MLFKTISLNTYFLKSLELILTIWSFDVVFSTSNVVNSKPLVSFFHSCVVINSAVRLWSGALPTILTYSGGILFYDYGKWLFKSLSIHIFMVIPRLLWDKNIQYCSNKSRFVLYRWQLAYALLRSEFSDLSYCRPTIFFPFMSLVYRYAIMILYSSPFASVLLNSPNLMSSSSKHTPLYKDTFILYSPVFKIYRTLSLSRHFFYHF